MMIFPHILQEDIKIKKKQWSRTIKMNFIKEKIFSNKISLKKILQYSYLFLIFLMIIPAIYSIVLLNIHIRKYDKIISNVSSANDINLIAKEEIPGELWDIVCGRKEFSKGRQYHLLATISTGINEMKSNTLDSTSQEKLEVATRTCLTLSKNIQKLEEQMKNGSSVKQNEAFLDDIRTITILFSEIMQDFIMTEIRIANETNNSIKKSSIRLTVLHVIFVLFSIFVALSSFISVSSSINSSLLDMENFSNQIAEGNLLARTTEPDFIELKPLARNMNKMASQIDLLIKKNIEEEKNFQKAEMKALQAQITPHFLYNTFDTILWLAEDEKTDDVVKITKAFSDFLRISLSRGHEWITVHQEVEHIANYLTIQKIRYADILNYKIMVNPEIFDFKIIKLVLQPLVENAIYHGIKNKRGRGYLLVYGDFADEQKQFIRFTVKDDGAGFTEERLAQVQKELTEGSDNSEKLNSVYGLYNVHKKLKLYYGENTQGIEIVSKKGDGASISFTIPCLKD